ncbi:MAG: LCP family protein [Eggerthellaceae bacterium]|nr:LCP family protein [Eggerthellaceae bacterium]
MFDSDKRRAKQSRRITRKMNDTVTYTTRGKHVKVASDDTANIGYSNSRKAQKASQGLVDQVAPSVTSSESEVAYSRRMSRKTYAQQLQHRRRMRHVRWGILIAVIAVIVAVGIGAATFFVTANSKLALHDSNAKDALVTAKGNDPYFVLCTAELGTATSPGGDSTQAYILVRVDEDNSTLTLVSIPSNIEVTMSDGNLHFLYEAQSVGGDAELIEAVSDFAGVDIAHYIYASSDGIASLVDYLGNVEMDVTELVDDPDAGTEIIYPGLADLNGESALEFLRASNYTNGIYGRAVNQMLFSINIFNQAVSGSTVSFADTVGEIGEFISTDLSSSEILSLGNAFSDPGAVTVYTGMVPGTVSDEEGVSVYVVDDDEWSTVMGYVNDGESPDYKTFEIAAVNPATITVDVRNGCGIDGAAAAMAEVLTNDGYQVSTVGNMDDGATYTETFVIYHDEEYEIAAEAISLAIGGGRVIDGGDYYSFTTDILVVVGEDWVNPL